MVILIIKTNSNIILCFQIFKVKNFQNQTMIKINYWNHLSFEINIENKIKLEFIITAYF